MNKAYRQVYKDGIGWVAIAENASSVSSSKGSGTVVEKSGVEVLKNFFDLRNSVVLNKRLFTKGTIAATLFCGVFVTQGFAEVTQKQILDIQNNGTTVYTDNDGNRMEKVINEEGEVIFADGSILNKADSDGIIHIDGKDYVVPTGTLNKPDTDEFGDKAKLFRVKKDETTGEWRGLTFKELKEENSNLKMGAITIRNGKFRTVIYDKDKKKWFVHNQASEAQLYQAKKKNGEVAYYAWTSIRKDANEVPLKTVDGYYMPLANATAEANEIENLGYDIVQVASKNKAERLSLVGIDGKTVKPIKYTRNDQEVKDLKRKAGDNKDGTIRLGNVAKAELDDEAVNLGQLNQKLQNVKAKVPYVHINSSITGSGSNHDNDGAKGENAIAIGPNAKSGNSSVAIGLSAKTGEGVIDKASYDKIKKEIESVKNKYKRAEQLGNQEKMAEFGKRRDELEELLKTYSERYEYNGKLITQAEYNNLSVNQQKEATIKYISNVMYENSVAIGYDAQALANDAVAIGNGAKVIVDGSKKIVAGGGVAIGQDSVSNAREDKDLKGYRPGAYSIDETSNAFKNSKSAWIATNQPFAVGDDSSKEKITRQITGVAAGNKDTDAVNVAQLKQIGFKAEGDIGDIGGKIQNEDKNNNTLKIKTDGKWENDKTKTIYTGKNLETRFIAKHYDDNEKKDVNSKFEIAMTDTPRFKSITITDENTVNQNGKVVDKSDNSPIELKKFNNNIGFAGENNSAIKLTNLAEGTIGEDSKDAITGSQLHATNESIKQNTSKITKKADLDAGNLDNKTGNVNNADETYTDVWKTKLGVSNIDNTINEFKNTGMFKVSDGTNETGIKVNDTITFAALNDNLTVSNNAGTITYGLSKNLKNINSITTENKGTLTINAGKETYTFDNGDNKNAGTNVVTNDKLTTKVTEAVGASKFAIKGDGNTKGEVKLSEGLSVVGGANSELSDKNIGVVAVNNSLQVKLAKNLLGLESAEFKKGADTTTVSAEKGVSTTKTLKVTDGSGSTVAEIDNTKITDENGNAVTNINKAINSLYDTTKGLTSDNALAVKYDSSTKEKITLGGSGAAKQVAITNLASAGDINDAKNEFNAVNAGDLKTALNSGNFISLSVSANGGIAKDEIKANENIDFTAKDGIKVAYDKNVNKFTFSADINSIAGNIADNDAFSTKYAMLNGNNLKPANGFDQNAWRGALGLKNSDIASIFKGEKGISIDKKANQYIISYKGTGGGTGTGGIDEDKVNEIIKKYIGGDNIGSSKGSTDNIVTHNVSKRETTNNKNIIAAINKINKEGIGFVHVNGGDLALDASGKSKNDSSAEGKNAIAIGPKSRAVGNNSISIGPNSKANGENSIAIGLGNEVTGKNSGAFGDPTYINEDNSYAIGNKNKIDSKDTFILGNKVTVGAGMQGAVVLGNNSNADKATQESSATVDGSIITYDGFAGQANGEGMILSVGAKGAERQIKNVAAGKISKDSTDAVNGSQLYATNKIIGNVASSVANVIGGGNAKVNNNGEISASNIGGTGKKTINDAIAYINNNNKSGNQYIAINTPKGSVLPNVSEDSNSIAIGAGSNDGGRKNVVSVGNAKTGLNRTITNVAPGKYGTDAVNMNQLYGVAGGLSKQINDVKKKSSAGIAGAVALGMLPQSNIPGDALVSIGTGYHDSESAVALGISKTSDNARWIFKGGVSYDSQDEVTAGASVGFHF